MISAMSGSTPSRVARRAGTAVLVVLTGLSLWPYLGSLGFGPMALDSVYWIVRGAVGSESWAAWTFGGPHFIGYRPLAAFSFSLTSVFAGLEPLAYRSFDLALHAANGVMVYVVARRLGPARPVWVAVLAASLFLWHPAAEEVVPWLARRHNGLASLFSLLAIDRLLVARGRPLSPATGLGSAAWLGAAVLSNEVAFATAGVLPFLALTTRERHESARVALRRVAPAVGVAAAALILRVSRVGSIGGYALEDAGPERVGRVFVAFWRDLLAYAPQSLTGELEEFALVAGLASLAVLCVQSLRELRTRPWLAVLAGWLLAASALLALQQVWFPRELYALLPVFAFWVAFGLDGIVEAARGRLAGMAGAGVSIAWLGCLLLLSPVLRGPEPARIAEWRETEALLRDLDAGLASLDGGGDVLLALPYPAVARRDNPLRARPIRPGPPRATRIPVEWIGARHADRGFAVLDAIAFPEKSTDAPVELGILEGGPALRFPDSRTFFVLQAVAQNAPARGSGIALADFPNPERRSRWLYLRTAGTGRIVVLPLPPE